MFYNVLSTNVTLILQKTGIKTMMLAVMGLDDPIQASMIRHLIS